MDSAPGSDGTYAPRAVAPGPAVPGPAAPGHPAAPGSPAGPGSPAAVAAGHAAAGLSAPGAFGRGAPGAAAPGRYLPDSVRTAVKLLLVGPFAVGKTTFVSTLSEIRPLRTEERMTQVGAAVDDLSGVSGKTTTTVAMDFGRLTLSDHLVLYLFGTPGQQRFVRLWHDLAHGALGALVLVDTNRLDHSFEVMDLVERQGIPYAVAINHFDGAPAFPEEEVREALDLLPDTPLVTCDARDDVSSTRALIALVDHLLTLGSLSSRSAP